MKLERSGPPPVIDTKHNIPYLAGYSKNSRIVYIDNRLPEFFKQRNGKIVHVWKYISIHEELEKDLIDKQGMTYHEAHEIATAAEKTALVHAGYDWGEYERFLAPYIKMCDKECKNVPEDLDLTPYRLFPSDMARFFKDRS